MSAVRPVDIPVETLTENFWVPNSPITSRLFTRCPDEQVVRPAKGDRAQYKGREVGLLLKKQT